ncbi:MAG: asparagine synthase (glutamine-hydrolyzing) [Planctomycetota bacterium]|nr:asparagine synthase (glutamine-hydrolyzing) [Planctomycetota bacterium]
MCGFAGLRLADPEARVQEEALHAMGRVLRHRGPDGEGQRTFGRVGLAHRRLSIIALKGGAQPMCNEDGSVWVVYNGEIYNFPTLRTELMEAGHVFATRCDTEVLVHGYEEWGDQLPEHLRGMFAFAVYDEPRDRLLLARDRLGIKPLYYAQADGNWVFGSEIRALLRSGIVRAAPDLNLIDAFVTLGYVPGRDTLFEGICKLRPGHSLTIDDLGVSEQRYWNLSQAPRQEVGYEDAKQGLLDLLCGTVEDHLISDVPLGVFLSGGVDSSAVTAILRRELGRDVATFSVGYDDDPESSELGHASAVAKALGTEHHEFLLTHEDFFENVDALLEHAEEPLVESAAVALLQLSRYTKQHATVLLSGEGADEVFAGYDLYGRNFQLERLRKLAFPLRSGAVRALLKPLLRTERLRKYLDWTGMTLNGRYRGISNDVTPSIRDAMYVPEFRAGAGRFVDEHFGALLAEVAERDPLARM